MSINHYKKTLRAVESPRQIERRIFARVTGHLSQKADAYDMAATSYERIGILAGGLREALAENQALWTALKHDLANPANALTPELRAGLLSLAIWVEKTTGTVLGGRPGVRALVEVNSNILTALTDAPERMSA